MKESVARMIYDITRRVFHVAAVFPGDTSISLTETLSLACGDSRNVGTLKMVCTPARTSTYCVTTPQARSASVRRRWTR